MSWCYEFFCKCFCSQSNKVVDKSTTVFLPENIEKMVDIIEGRRPKDETVSVQTIELNLDETLSQPPVVKVNSLVNTSTSETKIDKSLSPSVLKQVEPDTIKKSFLDCGIWSDNNVNAEEFFEFLRHLYNNREQLRDELFGTKFKRCMQYLLIYLTNNGGSKGIDFVSVNDEKICSYLETFSSRYSLILSGEPVEDDITQKIYKRFPELVVMEQKTVPSFNIVT